jgi:GT2 family glycosyltransferase/glycosyltransferase involved in cell wall biosynthesis
MEPYKTHGAMIDILKRYKMRRISADIIIVNYNSTDHTLSCIDSLKCNITSFPNRIIVVDNNSDDMPDRILNKYPDVKLIKNHVNIGFGNAINLALKVTTYNYIILINPDAFVVDASLQNLLIYIENNIDIAIAGPKILNEDGSLQGSARRFPTIWTSMFGRKSTLTKLFPNNPITQREFICFNSQKPKTQGVDWVSGACMVIRREALNQVNGFDHRFFLYWEDADLCKRLKHAGRKIIYYPQAKVYHHIGKSSNKHPLKSIFYFHRSSFYYFRKHSKWPIRILTPIALFGLALRCIFLMGLNIFQQFLNVMRFILTNRNLNNTVNVNDDVNARKALKILRIISRFNIGGPSIHCSILIKGLCKKQFESKLVLGKTSPHEGDMSYLINADQNILINVPEMQREINIYKDIKAFYEISKIIFREKPDIVHTHLAKAGAISRVAVFIHNLISSKKIKAVHTFHGNVLDGYFDPQTSNIFIGIEKALAKVTDAIIAISKTQKWELTEKYKIANEDKVHIINLGFDLARFSNGNGNGKLRTSMGVRDDTILIGIVGRLVHIKNHALFMDSAKLIREKFPGKDIRYAIIGDGELREPLESYAGKIGIRKSVAFYGWEKDIQKIYADLDILMLTSNNEGTPVSIIEAMASRVPVVTTGVGGVKDLLGSIEIRSSVDSDFSVCERGILCPKGNAEALANGIKYLVENDNHRLIQKARDFVLENYTDHLLIERVEKLYNNLI